ncbi:hypothetical protein CcCBS67573_g07360 [Chytriomyces confervae]|uniref:RNA-dependent RNA polymerase n=1 Tax=Chytriomyces confervae TaxID=246404 RepID=A0A507EWV4_9FUNG|nr:hypothetical protein CcCBS67573_g07360 [Chytriomyces confervae]
MASQQLAASKNSKLMPDLISKLKSFRTGYLVVFTSSDSVAKSVERAIELAFPESDNLRDALFKLFKRKNETNGFLTVPNEQAGIFIIMAGKWGRILVGLTEIKPDLLDETEVSLPVPEIWFGVWADNEATQHLSEPRQRASQIVGTNSFGHPYFEIDGNLVKMNLSAEMQIQFFEYAKTPFTSTASTVKILPSEANMYFPDFERSNYNFIDGIGTVSEEIASEMWDMLKKQDKRLAAKLASGVLDIVDAVLSAFQIQFGGVKGMVSVDPSLPGRRMNIRQSLIRFETKNSTVIEVADYSSVARDVYFNRQIILILEDLEVPKQVFLEL